MKIIKISVKILIITQIVILIVLNSCTEKEANEFNGIITDMSTGNPIGDVKVVLYASSVNSGSINSAFVQIAETTTDANGSYFLECDIDSYLKFKIIFTKDNYHSSSHEFDPTDQVALYTNDFSFARESYVYVRVHNTHPIADADQLKIRIERINEECTNCCSDNYHYYTGAYTDTSFICNTVGGDTVIIHSISIHNDESQIRDNKVYCIPGDTVFFNCIY